MMVRHCEPSTTVPGVAGVAGAGGVACGAWAPVPAPGPTPAASSPTARITRSPPLAGTWKGCDCTVSPSDVTEATRVFPAPSAAKIARPDSSVGALSLTPSPVTVTVAPVTLFPSACFTTRTEIEPSGSSWLGSAMPFISRRSGICADEGTTPSARHATTIRTRAPLTAWLRRTCRIGRRGRWGSCTPRRRACRPSSTTGTSGRRGRGQSARAGRPPPPRAVA